MIHHNMQQGPENFHPEHIPTVVSSLHPRGEVPILHGLSFDGGQCRVYRVDFHQDESWAVRIPIHTRSHSPEHILAIFERERDVLQEVSRIPLPWAPTLHGSILTFDNLVGLPIIVLSWVEGSPPPFGIPPTQPDRFGIGYWPKLLRYSGLSSSILRRIVRSRPDYPCF